MRLSTLRRPRGTSLPGVHGTVRLDRRTATLVRRLRPGDIAVVHHVDLDRASAEALVTCGVAAVVNVKQSLSGRYPNLGPAVLAGAGIPLVDAVGGDVWDQLAEGDRVRILDGVVYRGERVVAAGGVLTAAAVEDKLHAARAGLATRLEAFTLDAAAFLRREHGMLLDGAGIPAVSTPLAGRHVVVCSAAHDHVADLRALRSYLRERRPVLVGVDSGADALRAVGRCPDLVVGDPATMSDTVLRAATEVVVHSTPDGARDVLGNVRDRLERLGVDPMVVTTAGSSEDAALLLVDSAGAEVIVTAGSARGLVELLDHGRTTMATGVLTRLRVGPRLLDARAVAALPATVLRGWHLLLLVLAGLIAVIVAVAATPVGQEWVDEVSAWIRDGFDRLPAPLS